MFFPHFLSSSEHIIEIVMISLYEPKLSYCDLDVEDRNTFSHITLWLTMMYQHTGFGYKRFSES